MSIKALLGVRTRLRRAVTIVDAEQLGGAVMEQLASLFDEDGEAAGAGAPTRRRA